MPRVINRHYIKKGEEQHGFKGKTGAITLIQRFVFDENGKFFRVKAPKDEEVGEVILKIKDRVFRSLTKKEWIEGYDINFESDDLQEESPLLSDIFLVSIQNRLYLGTDKGKKVNQVGKFGTGNWVELKGNLCAYKDGFSLHANVMIAAHDFKGKERLIRYFGVLGPNSKLRRKVVKKMERKTKEKKGANMLSGPSC